LTIPNVQLTNAQLHLYGQQFIWDTNSRRERDRRFPHQHIKGTCWRSNPLAYWPLSENQCTVAFDMAGGYNGTYMAVSPRPAGRHELKLRLSSYSAGFDGASGYVDIPKARSTSPAH